MDAAQVGERCKTNFVVKSMTPEEFKMREVIIDSSYPLENHWMSTLPAAHYNLVGQYDLEEGIKLFRWVLDEKCRDKLDNSHTHPHVFNMIIRLDLKIDQYDCWSYYAKRDISL